MRCRSFAISIIIIIIRLAISIRSRIGSRLPTETIRLGILLRIFPTAAATIVVSPVVPLEPIPPVRVPIAAPSPGRTTAGRTPAPLPLRRRAPGVRASAPRWWGLVPAAPAVGTRTPPAIIFGRDPRRGLLLLRRDRGGQYRGWRGQRRDRYGLGLQCQVELPGLLDDPHHLGAAAEQELDLHLVDLAAVFRHRQPGVLVGAEGDEGVAHLAADDVHAALRDGQPGEVAADVDGVRRPRQVLESNYDRHVCKNNRKYV